MADAVRIDELAARRELKAARAAPPYRNIGDEAVELAAAIEGAQRSALLQGQLAAAAARARADEEVARKRDQAARQQQLRARLRTAGVPEDHIAMLVAGKVDTSRGATAHAKAWRAGSRRLLMLAGDTGTGKSLAACWLIAAGPRHPYPHPDGHDERDWPTPLQPRFIRAAQLAQLDVYDADDKRRLRQLSQCSLLVIDEVGDADVGSPTSWAVRLGEVVGSRYDAGLDTVMTANLVREEFRQMVTKPLFDRVTGTAGTWAGYAGPSMRQGGGR